MLQKRPPSGGLWGVLEGYQVLHKLFQDSSFNNDELTVVWLTEAEIEAFYTAGYEKRQLLEIILGLSQKVMSIYVNAIAETPVDAPFQKFAWEK